MGASPRTSCLHTNGAFGQGLLPLSPLGVLLPMCLLGGLTETQGPPWAGFSSFRGQISGHAWWGPGRWYQSCTPQAPDHWGTPSLYFWFCCPGGGRPSFWVWGYPEVLCSASTARPDPQGSPPASRQPCSCSDPQTFERRRGAHASLPQPCFSACARSRPPTSKALVKPLWGRRFITYGIRSTAKENHWPPLLMNKSAKM